MWLENPKQGWCNTAGVCGQLLYGRWQHVFQDSRKLITFKLNGNSSVIDYVVGKKRGNEKVKDVKIIPGEECFPQHRLFVMDLHCKINLFEKKEKAWKIKLWRHKQNKIEKTIKN